MLKIIFNVGIILQISTVTAILAAQRNFGNFSTKCPENFNVVDNITIDFKPGVRSLIPITLHVIFFPQIFRGHLFPRPSVAIFLLTFNASYNAFTSFWCSR